MAIQGRKALVKVSGTSSAFAAEATTAVTAGTVYQITSTAKRVWDRSATITVLKDAVAQAATLYTLNRLTGTITFGSTVGASVITVTGSYLPLSTAAEAKQYSYTVSQSPLDDTAFADSWNTKVLSLKSVSGSLSEWHTADTYFTDALVAGDPVVLEMYSDSAGSADVKIWAMLNQTQIESALESLVGKSVDFVGAADADGRTISG